MPEPASLAGNPKYSWSRIIFSNITTVLLAFFTLYI
jgi:hypothetical protein